MTRLRADPGLTIRAVGYRAVGHGPALVMITGFSASMDAWAPYFVNAPATYFRVVVFDSADIG